MTSVYMLDDTANKSVNLIFISQILYPNLLFCKSVVHILIFI